MTIPSAIEIMMDNLYPSILRYIATAGGKIPLHRSNVVKQEGSQITLKKPWSGAEVRYPDADDSIYAENQFSFTKIN